MERFNQKVNLQTQNLSGGTAEGLMSLSGKFQQIANNRLAKRENIIIEEQTLAGQLAHKKGDKPEFKKQNRIIGGVAGNAYNNGLKAAYTASMSNDIRADLAEIESKHSADSAGYKAKVEALRTSLTNEVDPLALPNILAAFDTYSTNGAIRVQGASENNIREQTTSAVLSNIDSLANEAAVFARNGDLRSSGQSILSAFQAIDAGVDSRMIEAHKASGLKRTIELRSTQENIIGLTRGFINSGHSDKAISVLESVRDKPLKGVTLDEQSNLMTSLIADVNQTLNLKNKKEAIEDVDASDAQEAKSQSMYVGIINGQINGQDIVRAMQTNSIDQSQGATLLKLSNTQGAGVDDIALINDIQRMIDNNESPLEINRLIASNTGGRLTQSTAGSLMTAQSDNLTAGSPLKEESYKSAVNFMEQMIAPKGFLGRFDIDSGKRFAILNREARERVLAGENPWTVIDSLIPKDKLMKSGMDLEGKYNGANNQAAMITALDGVALSEQLDADEYNKALYDIKTYWEQLGAYNATRESIKGATQ